MTFGHLYDNNPLYSDRRRSLRLNATKAEQVLWQEVRGKKLGHKFRRQYNIGTYIIDFYCPELRLAIELDGPVHDDERQKKYDEERDAWLRKQRITVIRFTNDEVLFHREVVIERIQGVCKGLHERQCPTISPPRRGRQEGVGLESICSRNNDDTP